MKRTPVAFGVVVLSVASLQIVQAQEPSSVPLVAQGGGGGRGGGGALALRVPIDTTPVKGAPYSAEVVNESVQVLSDGNRIVRKTTGRVYRDSQGRIRREEDREPGRVRSISITDPVAGAAWSLNPETKVAWKTPYQAAGFIAWNVREISPDPIELERRRELEAATAKILESKAGVPGGGAVVAPGVRAERASPWEEKTEKLAARQIEGIMAEGARTTRTIPAGAIGNEQPIAIVTEQWRSPELNVLVLTRTSDPRTGESTYRLLGITRSEPAPSWFEVPADYTMRETGIRREEARK